MRNNPYINMRASELTSVINDTIFFKETDKEIALNVFVAAMTVEKCASLVGYDSKVVQKRLPLIKERINSTLYRQ